MSDDLREKLRRLGIHKGSAGLEPRPSVQSPSVQKGKSAGAVQNVLGGRELETPNGAAYVIEEHFEADYRHGGQPLSSALDIASDTLGRLAYNPAWHELDLSRAAFIDTETTGLSGGTGTLAFLVGAGKFQIENSLAWRPVQAKFQIAQFFLRQPGEEAAMLTALGELLSDCDCVVTFNGRGFDMPLLQARFTLNRMFPPILTAPHLDLLLPARRVWRERLPSCALSALETHVLGVQREQADVPGYLIPQMYFDYLASGDASEIPRVLYHNAQDILSLATLAALLGRIVANPLGDTTLDPADLVSLARWHDDLGQSEQAERLFIAALERSLPVEFQVAALQRFGFLLKRQERYDEAARVWEQLAAVGADITAHVELAKHYEWRERNLNAALAWTQAALEQIETWLPGFARDQARKELEHRKKRLERKNT